jgi:hypothetical protein
VATEWQHEALGLSRRGRFVGLRISERYTRISDELMERTVSPQQRPGAALADLADRWAREAAEHGQLGAARALVELDDAEQIDREAALRALHELPDDDQPAWR